MVVSHLVSAGRGRLRDSGTGAAFLRGLGLTSDVAMDADAPTDANAPLVSRRAVLWGNLDLLLVAAAVVPALALNAPEPGFVLGAGGWILQRLVAVFDRRWIARTSDPIKRLAANLFEAFGRIWLLAGVIVASAAIGGRSDGLTASVVILAAYSVAFIVRLTAGPPARRKAAE
jgi:hypothetical protein